MSGAEVRVPVLPVRTGLRVTPMMDEIHQVWFGPQPAWVAPLYAHWDSFAERHDLRIRRWTDADLEGSLTGRLAKAYRLTPVQMADLFRIETLALRGGVYMDSDTYPIKPLGQWTKGTTGWFAHGNAWTRSGAPTVSNAMFAMPAGHPLMSLTFEHAAKALARGVKNTFDIAGPTVLRRLLNEEKHDVIVAPEGLFDAYRGKHKDLEDRLGRQLNDIELRKTFPRALVVHRSAVSWVTK